MPGRSLLEHETEAETAGRTHGEREDEYRHVINLKTGQKGRGPGDDSAWKGTCTRCVPRTGLLTQPWDELKM